MKIDTSSTKTDPEILYSLDDKPPWGRTLILAGQHVLAAFGGIIVVPIIIGTQGADGRYSGEVPFLVSCALIAAGLATILQTRKWGRIGSRLPMVMGTDFTFVGPGLSVVNVSGLAGYFTCTVLGSFLEMVLSFFIRPLRRLFPPLVTGTVICLIGMSLMPVAMLWIGGGAAARETVPSTFGAPLNLAVGFGVLLVTVGLAHFGNGLLRSSAVFLGLLCGYLASIPLGLIDFSPVAQASWFSMPDPFRYGWAFNLPALLIFLVAYVVTTIETVGDTLAVASAAGVEADDRRLSGAIMADGIGSFLGGLINAGPNTSFSQNVGLIPLTRVASTRVVSVAGVLLILFGIFPRLTAAVALLPEPVLGGAGLVMFGMVAAAGIRIMGKEKLDNGKLLVIAVSLGIGLGSSFGADPGVGLFHQLPETARLFFSSGISTGTLSAVLLNLLMERKRGTSTWE